MKIEPRTFTLPNGEVLTVRSLCADDAEALNAFRYATYSETYFMARYPEEGVSLEAMGNRLADCGESPVNFEVGAFEQSLYLIGADIDSIYRKSVVDYKTFLLAVK